METDVQKGVMWTADIVKGLLRKLKCFRHAVVESCGSGVSAKSAVSALSRALWRGEWSSVQLWVVSSLISLRLCYEYTSVMRLTGRDFVKSHITCRARYNVCICHNFVHFFNIFFFKKITFLIRTSIRIFKNRLILYMENLILNVISNDECLDI